MKLTKVKAEKERSIFKVEDTTPAFLNTMRRIMQNEVPVLAIEYVDFRQNSSVLYDEMVAHRLGLIPLTTDSKSYNLPNECKCDAKGCAQCQLKLTLKVDPVAAPTMIYAKDLKSSDPKVKPVLGDLPIVKLMPGQSLIFEATAQMGLGKDHAKWATGLVFYRDIPTITIARDSPEIKKQFPASLYEHKGKKLVLKNLADAIARPALLDAEVAGVERENSGQYLFVVESWGQLSPAEIMEQGIHRFSEQLKAFAKVANAEIKS